MRVGETAPPLPGAPRRSAPLQRVVCAQRQLEAGDRQDLRKPNKKPNKMRGSPCSGGGSGARGRHQVPSAGCCSSPSGFSLVIYINHITSIISCDIISHHITSCHTVSHHMSYITSCIILYRIISCIMSHHTISYITSYHTISYLIMSSITSYQITPYHIPYHITSHLTPYHTILYYPVLCQPQTPYISMVQSHDATSGCTQ